MNKQTPAQQQNSPNCWEKLKACWTSFWRKGVWNLFAILACIAFIIFICTTVRLHFQNPDNQFWDAANAVFAFLGILLTAGAAFATVAAVISYFSVNSKLKEAKHSLKKFKQLDLERKKLRNDIKELEKFNNIARNLISYDFTESIEENPSTEKQRIEEIKKLTTNILKNKNADFELRLKAHAILKEIEIFNIYQENKSQNLEEKWLKIIDEYRDNILIWKLLSQAASPETKQQACNNYVFSLLNYGTSYTIYADFLYKENNDKCFQQWKLARKQFKKALAMENSLPIKNQVEKIHMILGHLLTDEGNAIIHFKNQLSIARNLWRKSRNEYCEALKLKIDYELAFKGWVLSLIDESKYLSEEEKFELWQNARTEVLDLQKTSEAHQNSAVIQDLLAKIDQEIQSLSSGNPS